MWALTVSCLRIVCTIKIYLFLKIFYTYQPEVINIHLKISAICYNVFHWYVKYDSDSSGNKSQRKNNKESVFMRIDLITYIYIHIKDIYIKYINRSSHNKRLDDYNILCNRSLVLMIVYWQTNCKRKRDTRE